MLILNLVWLIDSFICVLWQLSVKSNHIYILIREADYLHLLYVLLVTPGFTPHLNNWLLLMQ